MAILEILRAITGIILVFFLPGYCLTLALWPKKKKEIYEHILKILKEKEITQITLIGRNDTQEELWPLLEENSIKYRSYEPKSGQEDTSNKLIKDSKTMVLMNNLDFKIEPEERLIIDLAQNFPEEENIIKVEDTIDGIERFTLSLGLSVAQVPILGLILDRKIGRAHV